MRTSILVTLVSIIAFGCASNGGSPIVVTPQIGVHQVDELNGSGTFGTLRILGMPYTYPVRWSGQGTLTLQYPQVPHMLFDGQLNFVVEPITPGQRVELEEAIAAGKLAIRAGGRPVGLSPSGTIHP